MKKLTEPYIGFVKDSGKDELSYSKFRVKRFIILNFQRLSSYWRLHDNPPLLHALKTSYMVFPVYIMDIDWQRKHEKFGINKTRFLLECLEGMDFSYHFRGKYDVIAAKVLADFKINPSWDLDNSLRKMGTRLFVLTGNAKDVLRQFCRE